MTTLDLTELTPAQAELQARARRFVEEVLFPLEEKAERRELPGDDVARIKSEAMAAELHGGLHAPRARRAGLVEARVGAGRGAVRALHQRAVVAHPDRVQRARLRLGRSRSTAGCGRRCAASCHDAYAVTEEHAGSDPSGIATTRAAPRRRLGDRRREVVRDLRRRRGGLHRRGERGGRGADAVPGRRVAAGHLGRRRPAVHAHLSARAPDDPLRGRRGARRGRHRRARRRRRAAARVVHRGADRDRGARGRGDVAAARRGDRVGAEREQGGRRIMDSPGRLVPARRQRRRRGRGAGADARRSRGWPTRAPTRRSCTRRRRWRSCS